MRYEDRNRKYHDNNRMSKEQRERIKRRQEEMKKEKMRETIATILGCGLVGGTTTSLLLSHHVFTLPEFTGIKDFFKTLGPRLTDLACDVINDVTLFLEQALYYVLYGITIIVGLPTAIGLVAAFCGSIIGPIGGILDALCAPASLVIRIRDDASYNLDDNQLVEANAKKIYDTFDHNHEKTLDNNATIIASCETSGEVNKLLRDQEKQRLLNELEALKQYKNEDIKRLILK